MFYLTLLQESLIHSVENYPSKIALKIDKESYTYEYILRETLKLSQDFQKHNLRKGGRVIIQAGNSLLTIIAFWAALCADGVASVISNDITDEKLQYILSDSDASLFVTNKVNNAALTRLLNDNCQLQFYVADTENICVNDLRVTLVKISNKSDADINRIHYYKKNRFNNIELDLASNIYTSGSTGEPKGVMLTHRNMLSACFSINKYLELTQSDIILSALPLSFDYGLYQMIMAFSVGATLVLEKNALFPAQLLKKIQSENVSIFPCVPTLFNILFEHGKLFKYDYSTLRAVTNTAAALTKRTIEGIKQLFPNVKIYSMYGLTECKRCSYLPPELIDKKPESVGIAIPNTELWIIDEQGHKANPGVIGQLVIRGPHVMKGYWKKPEETAKKLKKGEIHDEKVLHTGDFGLIDEDGFLYFKGRMDDVFKFKGIKISPIELETLLLNISSVRIAAVVGVEDDLIAFIETFNTLNLAEQDELKKQVKNTLMKPHQPSHIVIVSQLPKNANGKIDKMKLKNEWLQKQAISSQEINK